MNTRIYIQGDVAFRFGTLQQRTKAVNFDVCKKGPKIIGYHTNVPWAITKLMSVLRFSYIRLPMIKKIW